MDVRNLKNRTRTRAHSTTAASSGGCGCSSCGSNSLPQTTRAAQPTASARFGQIASVNRIDIESVDISPNPVSPGGNVTVTVTCSENAEFVSPLDPDTCNPPETLTLEGINAQITADPSWGASNSRTKCIAMWKQATGREDFVFEFDAPFIGEEAEFHTIDVELSLPGSGSGPDGASFDIQVQEDGSVGCTNNSDCPTGYDCKNGECSPTAGDPGNGNGDNGNGDNGGGGGPLLPCFVDPNQNCAPVEYIAYSALGFVVAVLVLQLR